MLGKVTGLLIASVAMMLAACSPDRQLQPAVPVATATLEPIQVTPTAPSAPQAEPPLSKLQRVTLHTRGVT
jgi:hypothetical protein